MTKKTTQRRDPRGAAVIPNPEQRMKLLYGLLDSLILHLHELITERPDELTAQHLNIARALLRDNGVNVEGKRMRDLESGFAALAGAQDLPFPN